MPNSVSFDSGCVVAANPSSVYVMTEMYCLGQGTTIKDFDLPSGVVVDAVAGTLSFYGLNWNWWKKLWRPSTAICGWIGSTTTPLVIFDIQGCGEPQLLFITETFPGGVALDKLRFNLYPDLTLPTDFRAALSFHRMS